MLFRSALVTLALVASASADSAPLINTGDVKTSSKFGQKLMSGARRLNNNNNNNYEDDGTWMVNYSIRFDKCHTQMMLMGENARRQLNDNAEESAFRLGHYVEFSVCPTSNCKSSSTSGCAQYLTSMAEFVDAYTESKMEEQERMCEYIREACVCQYDDGDDETCEAACYTAAGHTECIEVENENEEEFEVQRYLECQEMENNGNNNNNNNGNYQSYYVGPSCSNHGKSITLGVFTDAQCSEQTDSSIYAKMNYGVSLPYATTSLVAHDCISCEQVQEDDGNNYNNDQYQEKEISQLCQEVREDSLACEKNLGSSGPYYKNEEGCNYINNILPALDNVYQRAGITGSSGSGNAAKAFAWIFALGCVGLGGYVYFLHQKMDKKIDLSEQGGVSA